MRWASCSDLDHQRRTRVRFSVNSAAVARRFEGGTRPTPARLAALRALAEAGYPVGLTIAPVMPLPGWEQEYGQLLDEVGIALDGVADLDLTAEIITHRFTPASKDVLLSWYPQTKLEMAEDQRSQKRSKFGGVKYVYPRPVMAELRSWFLAELTVGCPPPSCCTGLEQAPRSWRPRSAPWSSAAPGPARPGWPPPPAGHRPRAGDPPDPSSSRRPEPSPGQDPARARLLQFADQRARCGRAAADGDLGEQQHPAADREDHLAAPSEGGGGERRRGQHRNAAGRPQL